MQAPISVYTSGKGSSAAGLTATVVRDNSGEFFLEVCSSVMQIVSHGHQHVSASPDCLCALWCLFAERELLEAACIAEGQANTSALECSNCACKQQMSRRTRILSKCFRSFIQSVRPHSKVVNNPTALLSQTGELICNHSSYRL